MNLKKITAIIMSAALTANMMISSVEAKTHLHEETPTLQTSTFSDAISSVSTVTPSPDTTVSLKDKTAADTTAASKSTDPTKSTTASESIDITESTADSEAADTEDSNENETLDKTDDSKENESSSKTDASKETESTGETDDSRETESTGETDDSRETESTGETDDSKKTESTGETDDSRETESTGETDDSKEQELKYAKKTAKEELTNYCAIISEGKNKDEKNIIQNRIDTGILEIEEATTPEAIEQIVKNVKAGIEILLNHQAKTPFIQSLEVIGGSSLSKLYPDFQPEINDYFFSAKGSPGTTTKTLKLGIEEHVSVYLNGVKQSVEEDGFCTIILPYKYSQSGNDLRLVNDLTGYSNTYIFHTFSYGVTDTLSNLQMLNAKGTNDDSNISTFTKHGNVSTAVTNHERCRLQWKIHLNANEVYKAHLTDNQGNILEEFEYVAGEKSVNYTIESKPIDLAVGQNLFFIRCFGYEQLLENGLPNYTGAVSTTAVEILRNEQTNDETVTDTLLNQLELYVNDVDSKNYLGSFSSAKKRYTVNLSMDAFEEARSSNIIYVKVGKKYAEQDILVTGGSALDGTSASIKEENGYYKAAVYSGKIFYRSDSFNIMITVTAKDKITQETYVITVNKDGKAAMYLTNIPRDLYIASSDPYRKYSFVPGLNLTDSRGENITVGSAIKKGHLKMQVSDESIFYWTGESSYGAFVIDLLKVGKNVVTFVYDDGINHLEKQVTVPVRYANGYLKLEIQKAQELLDSTQNSDRIYAAGAADRFLNAIQESSSVYEQFKDYSTSSLTEAQKDLISAQTETIIQEIERYRRSEIGRKITAFLPLSEEIANQTALWDTPRSELTLPTSVTAVIDGEHVTIHGITWEETPVYNDKEYDSRRYRFQAILPAGYMLMDGITAPEIHVERAQRSLTIRVKKTIPLDADILTQRVPIGTKLGDLILPNLEMYAVEGTGDTGGRITIPVIWKDLDGFDGNKPGIYRFKSKLNPAYPGFEIPPNSNREPMQTITVIVEEPVNDTGNGGSGSGTGNQPENGGNGTSGSGGETGNGNGSGNGYGSGSGNGIGDGTGTGSGNGSGTGNGSLEFEWTEDTASGSTHRTEGSGIELNGETPLDKIGTAAAPAVTTTTPEKVVSMKTEAPGKNGGGGKPTADKAENSQVRKNWKITEIIGDKEIQQNTSNLFPILLLLLALTVWGGLQEAFKKQREFKIKEIKPTK